MRALGSHQGHQRRIAGRVPFLKVVNDTAVAVNRAASAGRRLHLPGKLARTSRNSWSCAKNTGGRPPHPRHEHRQLDSWPVHAPRHGKGEWTLFSPSNVPDLHDLFGADFERPMSPTRKGTPRRRSSRQDGAGRRPVAKMLSMLFETGHPGSPSRIPCNVRSPQQHAGVVHSSNPVHRNHPEQRQVKPPSATWVPVGICCST